ncbi:hypothetical protein [Aquamicrobium sp. LC103]|uniref:hypothetical protein n=1 Tax=Aquamicrobium sp. LC103 TaxID=1120658 RepID=UPI00063ECC49|nr:hypothetical protein [Aquamicrobium sp. LC103]TKT74615.1 GguC protein [Aquamicrobium sp. LC103]
MLISQIRGATGDLCVIVREGSEAYVVRDAGSVYRLTVEAARSGARLAARIHELGLGEAVDLEAVYEEGRVLLPITHPDPARMHLAGSGRLHPAASEMGEAAVAVSRQVPSSRRGKGTTPGRPTNAQPAWFYRGNGYSAIAPGAPFASPSLPGRGGGEPEIAGIYVIGDDGTPFRLGFALANGFFGHADQRAESPDLASSEPRPSSFGPEILVGDLPADIRGVLRVLRGGRALLEEPFRSGETSMLHSIADLERNHFRHDLFRQPGDLHIHLFGAAAGSFADDLRAREGDVFEIAAPDFGLPLRNPFAVSASMENMRAPRVATL